MKRYSEQAGRPGIVALRAGCGPWQVERVTNSVRSVLQHAVDPQVLEAITEAQQSGEAIIWQAGGRYYYDDPMFGNAVAVLDLAYSSEIGLHADPFTPLLDSAPALDLDSGAIRMLYMAFAPRPGDSIGGSYMIFRSTGPGTWESAFHADVLTEGGLAVYTAGDQPVSEQEEQTVLRYVREYTSRIKDGQTAT